MRAYVLLAGYRTFENGTTTPVVFLSQKYGLPKKFEPLEGLFMPFGGQIEVGETVDSAAERELTEEVGTSWIEEHRIPGVSSPLGLPRRGRFGDLVEINDQHFLVLMVDGSLAAYRRLLRAVGERHEGGAVAVPRSNLEALRTAIAPHVLPGIETLFSHMERT